MFGTSDQRVGSFPDTLLRVCRPYFRECSSQISCFNNVSVFLEGHLKSSGSGVTFVLSELVSLEAFSSFLCHIQRAIVTATEQSRFPRC